MVPVSTILVVIGCAAFLFWWQRLLGAARVQSLSTWPGGGSQNQPHAVEYTATQEKNSSQRSPKANPPEAISDSAPDLALHLEEVKVGAPDVDNTAHEEILHSTAQPRESGASTSPEVPRRVAAEAEIKAARDSGDHQRALTTLLQVYGRELLSFFIARLGDRSHAEDAFVLLAEGLWSGLPKFEFRTSVRTWAYVMARNVVTRYRRDRVRHEDRDLTLSKNVPPSRLVDRQASGTQDSGALKDDLRVLIRNSRLARYSVALIVDDEPIHLEDVARSLGVTRVRTAVTIEQARLLLTAEVDLVLCDIRVGGGRGHEVFRLASSLSRPPLMIATGHEASPTEAFELLTWGVSSYLPKPVSRAQLIDCLQSVSGTFGRRARSGPSLEELMRTLQRERERSAAKHEDLLRDFHEESVWLAREAPEPARPASNLEDDPRARRTTSKPDDVQ